MIVYRLIATRTVEERIEELQERRKELAFAIVSANADPLSSMLRDDLVWLLSSGVLKRINRLISECNQIELAYESP